MSTFYITILLLTYLCQKLSKLVEIRQSYEKTILTVFF